MQKLILQGKEYPLELNLDAYLGICEISPDNRFENVVQILDNVDLSEAERFMNYVKIAKIMNQSYADKLEYEHPGMTCNKLSALPDKFFKYLRMYEHNELQRVVNEAVADEQRAPEVEILDTAGNV